MDLIELKTEDGIRISANHYKSVKGAPGAVLLHMMPATKESWREFAFELNKSGIGALAVDLRGHGQSDGGPNGYHSFFDKDHQKSIMDVRSAVSFQKTEGHKPIFVIGASIGANLALQILSEDPEIKGAILFSPGLDYKGIQTIPLASAIRPSQRVFMIAAKDDTRSGGPADKMSEQIFKNLNTENKQIKIFESGGHGTDIFSAKGESASGGKVNTDLMNLLINWLKD